MNAVNQPHAVIALAQNGEDFRREVATGPHSQVVVMTLRPGEEIGAETHEDADQVLLVVEGRAEAELDGRSVPLDAEELVLVAAGTLHNVRNTGDAPLRLISIYTPPEHPAGTVHRTKAEADAAEHDHHH